MKKPVLNSLLAPSLICVLTVGAASAGTVSITVFPTQFDINPETITFDDDAWADNASIAETPPGGTEAASPASGADGNLATATNLNDSAVELFFTDNVLINGPGDDLIIFQNTNNNVIRLSTDVSGSPAAFGGAIKFLRVDEPNNTSGFEIGVISYDLSDLGFADDAEVTDGLFLSKASIFSTVWDVAALNSRSVGTPPDPGVIPLPASLPLLLAGLLGFGALRHRRKASKT